MRATERNAMVLALISLAVGIVALVNEEYRIWVLSAGSASLVLYYLSSFSNEIEEQRKEIVRLQEKLKIHEQLIDLKAEVKHLQRGKR